MGFGFGFLSGGENANDDGKRTKNVLWKNKEKKFVVMGHRGSGMNMPEFSDRRMKAIRENTIRSFRNAGKFDLDFVEFDVQVLSDSLSLLSWPFLFLSSQAIELFIGNITSFNIYIFELHQILFL